MKTLLQISNYYPPDIGGIEIVAGSISQAAAGHYNRQVLCFSHTRQGSLSEADGVQIRRCGTFCKLFSQQLSPKMPALVRDALQGKLFAEAAAGASPGQLDTGSVHKNESGRPDVVILHAPNPFLEFLVLTYLPNDVRLIVYWHSDIVRQKLGDRIFRGMTLRLLRRADAVVATSPNYAQGSPYLSRFLSKCTVIPNCVDTTRWEIDDAVLARAAQIRDELDPRHKPKSTESKVTESKDAGSKDTKSKDAKAKEAGRILLVAVGRQVPYKGFEYLVRAMRELDERYVLVLIGREDTATREIRRTAEELPEDRIRMTGQVPDAELKAYLLAADVFCFPSITKNEAFGLALAEAMYLGLPAVTFTIPGSGVNYVNLDGETGIEVPNRDVSAYADAIRRLGENAYLRAQYGAKAAERVRRLFLTEQFDEAILHLLNEEIVGMVK